MPRQSSDERCRQKGMRSCVARHGSHVRSHDEVVLRWETARAHHSREGEIHGELPKRTRQSARYKETGRCPVGSVAGLPLKVCSIAKHTHCRTVC